MPTAAGRLPPPREKLGIRPLSVLNQGTLGGFFNSLGFGKRYAVGSNRSRGGPVPPDPEQARYFQPLAVEPEDEATSSSQARHKRAQRLSRPLTQRRLAATLWVAGRKWTRIHRALPLPVVALLYLLVAAGLCFLLARPLLQPAPVAANPLPLPKPSAPDFAARVAEVSNLIASKDFVRAREEVDRLDREYPNDPRVLMTRGAILAGERKYPEAHETFSRALEISPSSASALMNLAEIEFVMGRYPEARRRYEQLLSLQPKNGLIVFRLYLCARMEKDETAATAYRHSPALGAQSLEWYYVLAADDLFSGRKEQGEKLLEKARVLFRAKTSAYDKTLARLQLIAPID